jgi:transposase
VGSLRRERQYRLDAALDQVDVTRKEGEMAGYGVLAGVDWATASHRVCVISSDGTVLKRQAVAHRAGALSALVDQLIELADGDPERVAVAIETPHGAVVEAFLARKVHVYFINPKQLDRFRDRHSVAGAKDDALDAYVLADSLRTDERLYRRVEAEHPLVLEIREVGRADHELRGSRNRLINQFREQVYRIAPQLLDLCPSADEPWFWEFVEKVFGTHAWARPSTTRLQRLLERHRIRRVSAEVLVQTLAQPSLQVAPGVAEACAFRIALLYSSLCLIHEQRSACTRRLEALLEQLSAEHSCGPSDVEILLSLPGVGVRVGATFVGEAATALNQVDIPALRTHTGIAPVTRQSGRSKAVSLRRACNHRLRDSCYHWAHASLVDPGARQYYDEARRRGHSHARALRGVADRWLRILAAMLRNRTTYSPGNPEPRIPKAA